MQVTASHKYENVYSHPVPTQPSRLPQFVWIKPRPLCPQEEGRQAGVLGVRGLWGGGTRPGTSGHGASSELRIVTQEIPVK